MYVRTAVISILWFSWPAFAGEILPCTMAGKALSEFYGYLSPQEVNEVKACAAKKPLCIITEDGLISAETPQQLPKTSSPASFGLVQVSDAKQSACLAAIYSGGSAASWLFDGWRVESGKPVALKKFSATRLNSDSVSAAGLFATMQKAYRKN